MPKCYWEASGQFIKGKPLGNAQISTVSQ
jgi:hypothetical protein